MSIGAGTAGALCVAMSLAGLQFAQARPMAPAAPTTAPEPTEAAPASDPPPTGPPPTEATPTEATPQALLALGLFTARPTALATGLSTGLGLGWQGGAHLFTYGLHLAWSSATEFTRTREVRHDDVRLRARAGLRGGRGLGVVALQLGLGPTLVAEHTTRNQGRRAGLTGSDLETSAQRLAPGLDLEASVGLRLWQDWGVLIGGGPNLHLIDGEARFGWQGAVSAAWMPRP